MRDAGDWHREATSNSVWGSAHSCALGWCLRGKGELYPGPEWQQSREAQARQAASKAWGVTSAYPLAEA